ncbi:MAG: hypothetical protein MHMPM18_001493 [Marteilia pararefringens]
MILLKLFLSGDDNDLLDELIIQKSIRDRTNAQNESGKETQILGSIFDRLNIFQNNIGGKKQAITDNSSNSIPSTLHLVNQRNDILLDKKITDNQNILKLIPSMLQPQMQDTVPTFKFNTQSPDELYSQEIINKLKLNARIKDDGDANSILPANFMEEVNEIESAEDNSPDCAITTELDINIEDQHVPPCLPSYCVCGDVDSGKSTLIGQILKGYNPVSSEKLGKKSVDNIAWICDSLDLEREKGITIHSVSHTLEYEHIRFSLVDSPGHVDFTNNMIESAQKSNHALLIIDGSSNALEKNGFMNLGNTKSNSKYDDKNHRKNQTTEHLLILKTFGIMHVTVAVNKLEVVGEEARDRYNYIESTVKKLLTKLGFKSFDFVPCSAKNGINIFQNSTDWPWYDGRGIVETITYRASLINTEYLTPVNHIKWPMLCVISRYIISNRNITFFCQIVGNKTIKVNERCCINGNNDKMTTIKSISDDTGLIASVSPSRILQINVKFSNFQEIIEPGDCLFVCKGSENFEQLSGTIFNASVFTFDSKIPLTVGMQVQIFCHFRRYTCKILAIQSVIDKKPRRVLKSFEKANLKLESSDRLVMHPHAEYCQLLSHFLIKNKGLSIGAGKFESFSD